jgi:predicted dehydrogenase
MINIGVIGCGHWGPNHVRVFSSLRNSKVIAVADLDPQRLQYVIEQYPTLSVHADYSAILENSKIDAVVISTPTDTHYHIVKHALQAGKHVLCEKPLCRKVNEGEELVVLARERHVILMVGHVFLFNTGILKLKELLTAQALGKIFYFSATRTNLGPIRQDVNAVYDLATHDISICNFLLDYTPLEVSAVGVAFLQSGIQDVAFISLKYPSEIVANIRVSWLDPKKVRQMTIVGDKKMATWDDLAEVGPVVIYDKGVIKEPYYSNYGEFQLLAREGDVTVPKIKPQEPLGVQNSYFLSCIEQGVIRISDGQFGVDVVRILAAVNDSIASGGQPVAVR